mgnify:CR=1 FL=1
MFKTSPTLKLSDVVLLNTVKYLYIMTLYVAAYRDVIEVVPCINLDAVLLSTFGAKFLIILILFVISFAENVKDDDDAYEKVVENITELTSSIDV